MNGFPMNRFLAQLFPAFLCLCLAVGVAPAQAQDHSAHGDDKDPCIKSFGVHSVRLTAYQETGASQTGVMNLISHNTGRHSCVEVPAVGPATLVVDLVDHGLRETPVGLKIVLPDAEASAPAVFTSAPTLYPRGIIEVHPVFDKAGKYMAVLSFGDDMGAEHQMALFVAQRPSPIGRKELIAIILIGIVGMLITGQVARTRRARKKD
jgi:hypothetical protein